MWTHKSKTLTQTAHRTDHVTRQFIITQWTVRPAVTQVVTMETRCGRSTSKQSWTLQVLTALFVLVIHTVVHGIAPCVDRQTVVVLARTAIVRVRTGICIIHWT